LTIEALPDLVFRVNAAECADIETIINGDAEHRAVPFRPKKHVAFQNIQSLGSGRERPPVTE
jgi:hypothetical protein